MALKHGFFRLTGHEEAFPTLLDVASFLYDLNLLYEFLRLSVDPVHQDFVFSQYAYYRNGRPLQDFERLHVASMRSFGMQPGMAKRPGARGSKWLRP